MTDHNEILEAANDIIKNVTPGNPNAMTASRSEERRVGERV